ncbi:MULTISPECIES: hypothetical protein [Bacillus]|uniref:DUF1878 domain-containing protein n=1 Tax=Bacillus cereus TaxID=1396 RepID=A0A9X6GCW7_BACCE|nr:hypothetical protein [Bacillus cereus]OOR71312.1 hypothetical protein BLX06_31475 [Bacillus cereus]
MGENEYEFLKYKIEILHKMVDMDANPLYDYILDYDISREQHTFFINVLTAFSVRSTEKTHDSDKYMDAHKDSMISKYSHLDIPDLESLFLDNKPSFKEFETLISKVLPKEVNPLSLLKRTKQQKIYVELCEYLIADSEKQDV